MESQLYPFATWIWLQYPGEMRLPYYTYLDRQCGFSAQVSSDEAQRGSCTNIFRLTKNSWQWDEVTQEERLRLNLPEVPDWLQSYGQQPNVGKFWGHWRTHELLKDKLLEDYPDDLQVKIHDGGPRRNKPILPELVWVRVCGLKSYPFGDVFDALLLNKPHHTRAASQYDYIRFMASPADRSAILVTDQYVSERSSWKIQVCDRCGISEAFDPPADLYGITLTHPPRPPDSVPRQFSFSCPVCTTARVAAKRESEDDPYSLSPAYKDSNASQKKWWHLGR